MHVLSFHYFTTNLSLSYYANTRYYMVAAV